MKLRKDLKEFSRREFLKQLGFVCCSYPLVGLVENPLFKDQGPCPHVSGKTITFIVPNAPGGGYDMYARLLEPYLEESINSEIVIKNLSGAGGLIGAQNIIGAVPDGTTIGIINSAGLLAAALAGGKGAPHPANDFTILARIAASRQIWATGNDSPFRNIEDVFTTGNKRSIVFGTRDVGSLGFINMTLTSHLLGLAIEIVPGYLGSSAGVLAAARGEVDLIAYNFDSIRRHIESGDVRPLLQISNFPISSHPSLKGVPVLGGADGFAVRHSRFQERNGQDIESEVTAIVNIIAAGRLVVAPPRMDKKISDCLEETLLRVLLNSRFQTQARQAGLSLDIAGSEQVRQELFSISRKLERFVPIIDKAIRKVRK